MQTMVTKVAIVTGANKGIGLGIVKGLCERFGGVVYLTSRCVTRGKAAVKELKKLGLHPEYHQLDVADRESVKKFSEHIKYEYGGIDILVNNAAVTDTWNSSYEEAKTVIDINYKSLLTIQELIFPLMRMNGRILNISSDCGHLSNVKNTHWAKVLSNKSLSVSDVNEFVEWFLEGKRNKTFNNKDLVDGGTVAAYRISKVAMSALTVIQQRELNSRNISVNSVHPGHVQTDMTCGLGFYDVDEAAKMPLYLVLEAPQNLKGAYVWHDGKVLDWFDYNADYYFKSKELLIHGTIFNKIYFLCSIVLTYCKKKLGEILRIWF